MSSPIFKYALPALSGVSLLAATAAFGFQVYGSIGDQYAKLGGAGSRLGAPKSDESDAAFKGRFNEFAGGVIYWHPITGAHAVWGGILAEWTARGREQFGYPATDESVTPDGRGRYNHFRAVQLPGAPESSIYWTPQTGAHEIHGAIREKWASMGWENSPLGYPTSDEVRDGAYVRNNFEHGYIRWSAATGIEVSAPAAGGAVADGCNGRIKPYGLIGDTWRAMGGDNSPLGCPVSEPRDVSSNKDEGAAQSFQFGQIAWSPRTGGKSMQVAYQVGSNGIEVLWTDTQPFHYDFWIVRGNKGSANLFQKDIKANASDGWFKMESAQPGQTYWFVAEGCDEKGFLGEGQLAGCRQGWMNPVAVTIHDTNPHKPGFGINSNVERGTGCFTDPKCAVETVKQTYDTIRPVVDAIRAALG